MIERRFLGALFPLVLALFASTSGVAAPFDEASGRILLADEAFGWDFESLASLPGALSLQSAPPASAFRAASAGEVPPIEGAASLWLDSSFGTLELSFTDPEPLWGKRVELSFWQRHEGFSSAAELYWTSGERTVARLPFGPTGRATGDGWYELSTGPIDFGLAGILTPKLKIQVANPESGTLGRPGEGAVQIDALSLAELGPALASGARCTGATEAAFCGTGALCFYGRCADAASVLGRLPPRSIQSDYVARRRFEMEEVGGLRLRESVWAAVEEALGRAEGAENARDFWDALSEAYELLRDSHGVPPEGGARATLGLGACLHWGDADLLPQPSPLAPLVFYRAPGSPAESLLAVGDALTAIDGEPLATWRARMRRLLRYRDDPDSEWVALSPELMNAAIGVGSTLTFARCPKSERCAQSELVEFEVKTYDLIGEKLYSATLAPGDHFTQYCDYRFQREGSTAPNLWTPATSTDGTIRTLLFNHIGDEGSSWAETVTGALVGPEQRFLLDERVGYGGIVDSVAFVASPFIGSGEQVGADIVPALDSPYSLELRENFAECRHGQPNSKCGGFIEVSRWNLGPNPGALANAKVALLVGWVISSNEFLTGLMQLREGPTRVFGPGPTLGGFGNVIDMPAHYADLSGGRLQVSDAMLYTGGAPQSLEFHSGRGAKPDVEVRQSQRDLLLGVDTVVERARAWLLDEGSEP